MLWRDDVYCPRMHIYTCINIASKIPKAENMATDIVPPSKLLVDSLLLIITLHL